ncbi:hypothetical protein ONS96_012425 [Cadophora gregata f. sp. sojae]|nr:hypothetical protein ONS96_012425 [Cadophora gregata f. sp. sojae]
MSTSKAQAVNTHYSLLARSDPTPNNTHALKVASSFGYTPEDLAAIPSGANLGVSCGNPLAIAGIKPGETILDLGSGAGFDIFQASLKLGPSGHAIGIDSSPDMLSLAHTNASKLTNPNPKNIQFILADISTTLPLDPETIDCIISNCVINLLAPPEKKKLCFSECFRVLKRGGRLAVSDILAKRELGEEMRGDLGLFVGCVGGASLVGEYERWLREVGFEDVLIVDKKSDLNIYKERVPAGEIGTSKAAESGSSCCAPATSCCGADANTKNESESAEIRAKRVADIDFNEWVSSFSIYAVKPKK